MRDEIGKKRWLKQSGGRQESACSLVSLGWDVSILTQLRVHSTVSLNGVRRIWDSLHPHLKAQTPYWCFYPSKDRHQDKAWSLSLLQTEYQNFFSRGLNMKIRSDTWPLHHLLRSNSNSVLSIKSIFPMEHMLKKNVILPIVKHTFNVFGNTIFLTVSSCLQFNWSIEVIILANGK